MQRTFSVTFALLAASSALAQSGDEWSSPFPASSPASAVPAPEGASARPSVDAGLPTPVPSPAPGLSGVAPTPPLNPVFAAPPRLPEGAPPTARAAASSRPPRSTSSAWPTGAADAGAEAAQLPLVAKQERFEPGTEPHSPATWGNALDTAGNARVTAGQTGIGGLFVPAARLGPQGVVRVGFVGEYLNLVDFPVRNARDIRSGITFAASYQAFAWGEAYLGYFASANTNNRTAPNLLQTLGDLTVGFKASRQWVRGFWAGADVRLMTFAGVGNQGLDRFAVGVRPTLLATYDVRALAPKVPLIATATLGFTFDGTGTLVTQTLNASEEFALGVHRYNRLNTGFLLEAPLPSVTPFVEYRMAVPLSVSNGVLAGPDGVDVAIGAAMPQVLGFGAKLTAIKDLTLTAGIDVGLARSVGLGVPATPPWNLLFGAAFAIDPWQRGDSRVLEIVRERLVERATPIAPPKLARVAGTVTDAATKQPLPGAVVSNEHTKPSASDAEGRYETLELTAPMAKVVITREGYKAFTREVTLTPGTVATLDVALAPEVRNAVLDVSVTAGKKPIKAVVSIKGPAEQSLQLTESDTAPRATELPAGTYTVQVDSEGFLSQTRDVQISAGGAMPVAFDLIAAPKRALVVFKGEKIEILQQVRFATGKATILGDSHSLLAQVVDSIIKNGVKRVRVEGHTDNRGSKEANQKLAEDRARAVAEYLIGQGIDAGRLESVGYGDTKPLAPNLTARGRELNRRVEFIVLEK